MPVIGLVHTVHRVIPAFAELARELLPGVTVRHFLDESTLQDAIAAGELTPAITRAFVQLVLSAAERCDTVMVTCSSMGPCVDLAASMSSVPVIRVDTPMCREAVAGARCIGVAATLSTTLDPTAALVERCAEEAGRPVTVRRVLCEGAFAAAVGGDQNTHDRLVLTGLESLLSGPEPVEVIVLAQASMAGVAEMLTAGEVPVLSSPRSGIAWAGEVLRTHLEGR